MAVTAYQTVINENIPPLGNGAERMDGILLGDFWLNGTFKRMVDVYVKKWMRCFFLVESIRGNDSI